MRILRIGIKNLNSLRGEQVIDFTASPLSDNQLYAIVGATGAGKTTILDAITLALYGQTERNKDEKDRKDGSGSIMSYGEGECRAELEYETATGRFRNLWHRQRAHKRPEKDLTPSRREISKWHPETDEWILLATKKKEVDERTLKEVGLDYERFVRSVMLTQGDFARFLKSKPGDKAAILEKITGTEIYKDLSVAAYQRHKLAKTAYDASLAALSVAPPLSDEVRDSLAIKLKDLQEKNGLATKEREHLQGQLAKHEKVQLAEKEAISAQTAYQKLQTSWEEALPNRNRLTANDRLAPLREDLATLQVLRERIAALRGERAALTQTLTSLRSKQQTLAAAKTQALTKRKTFAEKLPEREAKFSQAAVLE
ncbi:MAG: AAA family ATPase, partial [Bacteroidota bacterium]